MRQVEKLKAGEGRATRPRAASAPTDADPSKAVDRNIAIALRATLFQVPSTSRGCRAPTSSSAGESAASMHSSSAFFTIAASAAQVQGGLTVALKSSPLA